MTGQGDKLRELRHALIDAGFVSLDQQAAAWPFYDPDAMAERLEIRPLAGRTRKDETMTAENPDDLLPTRFAEIRVTEGRRVRIKVSKDDGRLIWGFEVDRHGVVCRTETKDREERRFFACAIKGCSRTMSMPG